jgi:hypothetical protein
VCLSCSFFPDSYADGCAFQLQRNELLFVFNTTRHSNRELVLLECFPVPAVGEFNVHVYEIQHGKVQEPTGRQIDHVVIKDKTLIQANVTTVNGGICGSCYFPNNSAIRGCTIELQNDEYTFQFNMSRQSNYNLVLLECFAVPQAGVFHVVVHEIPLDNSRGYHSLELPDITNIPPGHDSELDQGSQMSTVTGLSVLLSLAMVFLILAMLIVSFLLRKHMSKSSKSLPPTAPQAQEQRAPSAVTTDPQYENTELPPSTSAEVGNSAYELKPVTKHEKEIDMAPNAAYGSVLR